MFRPGTHFREFFFPETADTNANTQAGSEFGGFGGLFKLSQRRPSGNTGTLTLLFLGEVDHTSFDNLAFCTEDLLVAGGARGATPHGTHNGLRAACTFHDRPESLIHCD